MAAKAEVSALACRSFRASLPQTPQPLFCLPKRSSSLAFSSGNGPSPNSSNSNTRTVAVPHLPQRDLERERTILSAQLHSGTAQQHGVQMHSKLRVANVTLHRDMLVASSPASSIESRMNLDPNSPIQLRSVSVLRTVEEQTKADTKIWRYSTVPENLALSSIDVREPLPSPTLPEMPSVQDSTSLVEHTEEPVSSGFTSPCPRTSRYSMLDAIGTELPTSHSPSDDKFETCVASTERSCDLESETELEEPMTHLNVSVESLQDPWSDESPLETQAKHRSHRASLEVPAAGSTEQEIYLSETAEAAAESAKAKRRLLRSVFATMSKEEIDDNHESCIQSLRPRLYERTTIIPCPDYSVHGFDPSAIARPLSSPSSNIMICEYTNEIGNTSQSVGVQAGCRATSTGSPMPFMKQRATQLPNSREVYTKGVSNVPLPHHAQYHNSLSNHFDAGWYYANELDSAQACPIYSFSTAASKAVGSDQAPDSRIRDSYKTDTLTALVNPPSRFRKNGIGADLRPRGIHRYYQRPPSLARPSSARTRPGSRQTYSSGSDVRFQSSPPPGTASDYYIPTRRKRAVDDVSPVVEDQSRQRKRVDPTIWLHQSQYDMQTRGQLHAAVQPDIVCQRGSEALQHDRLGMQELSPNVQMYRKGVQQYSHHRKKRRPSYWDNDLKEIRESPAGRGGVNSPVSAQASMRAEFEIASLRNIEMDLDENDFSGEVGNGGSNFEGRLNTLE